MECHNTKGQSKFSILITFNMISVIITTPVCRRVSDQPNKQDSLQEVIVPNMLSILYNLFANKLSYFGH